MIKIRLATNDDVTSAIYLLNQMSEEFHSKIPPLKDQENIYKEIITRSDMKIFLAEQEGKIVGLITLFVLPNIRHAWHRGHIDDVVVDKDVRDQGIGTQLFEVAKAYCRDNSIKVIKLDSGNDLIKAHEFYKKNGGKQTQLMFEFYLG